MSNELSKMMLARGFDLKQNVKDRRDADSNQKLAQLLTARSDQSASSADGIL